MSRRRAAAVAVAVFALVSCGDEPRELSGFRRDPAPEVGDFELPDLSAGGAPFALRAEPGELLVVYFGFTNCPDFCPTTLADVRAARRRLEDPDRVEVAMISVDPERDLPVLDEYVTAFFPEGGHALGTDDPSLLARVAAPFGAQYEVTTGADGEVDVGHRTDLYAVDDEGRIALTWSFPTNRDELIDDFEQLLEESSA